MRGAARRTEAARDAAIAAAWTTAALMRSRNLPKLDRLLTRRARPQARQSREVLQAMCDALAAAWGATEGT